MSGWRDRAACQTADPDMFFPDRGHSPDAAKAICAACPVRIQCRDEAIANNEQWGVWGGLTENERSRVRRLLRDNPPLGRRRLREYEARMWRAAAEPADREQPSDPLQGDEGPPYSPRRANQLGVCVYGHDLSDPDSWVLNGTYTDGRPRKRCRDCLHERRRNVA